MYRKDSFSGQTLTHTHANNIVNRIFRTTKVIEKLKENSFTALEYCFTLI